MDAVHRDMESIKAEEARMLENLQEEYKVSQQSQDRKILQMVI